MSTQLYNLEILRLAASVADRPRLEQPDATVERRSPTCGSRVTVDVTIDRAGRVVAFGQAVKACALGQAAAALLGNHVLGQTADALTETERNLREFLQGTRDDPGDWPGLAIFGPARPHSARHASVLLAFEAAAEATRTASAKTVAS